MFTDYNFGLHSDAEQGERAPQRPRFDVVGDCSGGGSANGYNDAGSDDSFDDDAHILAHHRPDIPTLIYLDGVPS